MRIKPFLLKAGGHTLYDDESRYAISTTSNTQSRYPQLRSQFPTDGRRKLCLRVAQKFWDSLAASSTQLESFDLAPANSLSAAGHGDLISNAIVADNDPYDDITNGPELGILLRTDYSNEPAWQSFLTSLHQSEKDLSADQSETKDNDGLLQSADDVNMDDDDDDESESDSDTDEHPLANDDDPTSESSSSSIFKIISISTRDKAAFTNISNLAALRLLNDVDIRPSPQRPPETPRINPPNRFIDHGGWQEIYVGKPIWIYDNKSNTDLSVRVVSHQGDVYGTATGDNWRARVSHICELQINMYNGMKINFGGLDGWDHSERRHNMYDVNPPASRFKKL